MFKHLLVPLDGSPMAEATLPAVASLAKIFGASVTLFHVIEHGAPQEIHGQRHLTNPEEAEKYLMDIASASFTDDIPVQQHVHSSEVSDVAKSIVGHVEEMGADLIVMCTHGRGGVRGFMFGRIAQQVAGLDKTPVLLVPPVQTTGTRIFSLSKILVTLDGNPEHEDSLLIASGLAQICKAELNLLMVVHKFNTLSGEEAAKAKMHPGATHVLLDLAAQEAREYLHRLTASLQAKGLAATAVVYRGDPAKIITSTAEQLQAGLIILATHGKTGMDAFWSGSATPNVTSRSIIPLLLVPV